MMAWIPLKYVSEAKLIELRRDVRQNLARYTAGNFLDLERENGWAVESPDIQMNAEALQALNPGKTAEADIINSISVYRALKGLTPALAREERVWVRLTHMESLDYMRTRWLPTDRLDIDSVAAAVETHAFAKGLTGIRDDNALSRLWWNMHIATIADPDDPEGALRLIAARADFRKEFVERPGTAMRRPLAQAIVRAMRRDQWLASSEQSFRSFMGVLNRSGGGLLFEVLPTREIDLVLDEYIVQAKSR